MDLKVVNEADDLLKVHIIRGIVFIEEQACPYDLEIDEYESTATHVLGEVAGEPAACGRLRFLGDWAKIERVAIRKAFRGGGSGQRLVQFMMDVAREYGFAKFKLHGQIHLKTFYEKLGFEAKGEPFEECGITHLLFVKEEV